jgi:DNA-binding NtrC family response regulator
VDNTTPQAAIGEALGHKEFRHNVLNAAERSYLEALLNARIIVMAEAARRAAMDGRNLYDKLARVGLHV